MRDRFSEDVQPLGFAEEHFEAEMPEIERAALRLVRISESKYAAVWRRLNGGASDRKYTAWLLPMPDEEVWPPTKHKTAGEALAAVKCGTLIELVCMLHEWQQGRFTSKGDAL